MIAYFALILQQIVFSFASCNHLCFWCKTCTNRVLLNNLSKSASSMYSAWGFQYWSHILVSKNDGWVILIVQPDRFWKVKDKPVESWYCMFTCFSLTLLTCCWRKVSTDDESNKETTWCWCSVVFSYTRRTFREQWSIPSCISFLGTSPWYNSVATVALRLWVDLCLEMPA